MLGTALQFRGVRGEDRFYIPVKARKNQNQRKQLHRPKNAAEPETTDSAPKTKLLDSENNNSNDESLCSLSKPSPCESVETASNIDRFLESTTPLVPAQYFSKTTMRGWKTCDVEYQSYFTLDDLWESFKEWSAYGAGVPLLLDQNESVVQYYVPYLSAIQLYGQSSQKSSAKPRYTSEDSDGDYYRDSCSDESSDYEYGKRTDQFIGQSSQYLTGDVSLGMSRLSVHDKPNTIQEGFSSDDSETGNPQDLVFEYFEPDPPYSREPLADKACGGRTPAPVLVYPNEMDGIPKISLSTFAMASYKLKGSMWMKKGVGEGQLVNSLFQAADNWLRLLQVNHPDYQFFKSWRRTTGEVN
ncbi:hypothetical protein Ahy_A03g010264 isoform E [Arachis hypogaea]|uniref:DUF789 family protein n=1 Tax=Arachis hypogaea TaxID=3818 RepID=A0A445DLM3_ARAHY|nr:hypothetical protein Ahy_A03g010264 isoform E [Arachis hypogaea]